MSEQRECRCDDGQGMVELQMIERELTDDEGTRFSELGMVVGGQFWPFRFCPSCGKKFGPGAGA